MKATAMLLLVWPVIALQDYGAKPHIMFLFCDNVGWANVGFHRDPPTPEVVSSQLTCPCGVCCFDAVVEPGHP
jgi:arylsulfatase I/J